MDSVTLLHYVKKILSREPLAITFDYGSKQGPRERWCAEWQCKKLGVEQIVVDVKNLFEGLSSPMIDTQLALPDVSSVLGDPQPPT